MKRLLLFAFFAVMNWSTAGSQCVEGDVRLEDPVTSDPDSVTGVVQLCTGGVWRTACISFGYRNSWDEHAASLVCRQLGYSSEGSNSSHICSERVDQYIKHIDCSGVDTSLRHCSFQTGTTCTNLNCDSRKRHAAVTCLKANCTDGEVRLVGGTTNREGRVEVCMDGYWGTVCDSDNDQNLARAVCSQLEYPAEGSLLRAISPSFAPVYSCSLNTESRLICTLTNNTACNHTRDFGVLCLLEEELEQVIHNNNLTKNCSQMIIHSGDEATTLTPFSESENCSNVTTSEAGTSNNDGREQNCTGDGQLQMISGSGPNNNGQICISVTALGGVVGVLVALLMILLIGWSLSCVVLVKRNSKNKAEEKQADGSTVKTTIPTTASTSADQLYANITDNPAYKSCKRDQRETSDYEHIYD